MVCLIPGSVASIMPSGSSNRKPMWIKWHVAGLASPRPRSRVGGATRSSGPLIGKLLSFSTHAQWLPIR